MREFDLSVGGSVIDHKFKAAIKSPYDGSEVGHVAFGGTEQIEQAIQSTCNSAKTIASLPAHQRASILKGISSGLSHRLDELAETIRDEAGKPIKLARLEVERAVSTFAIAAEEAVRIEGEVLPFDKAPHGTGRMGLVRRFPIGPILAITPFNFPLNLVAHKVAPALAAGNSILVKPSSQAPMSSLVLLEIAHSAGLPLGVFNVCPCSSDIAESMVADLRFKMLTFTGSPAVGWNLKNRAGKKRVTLELGGNAAAVVEPDSNIEEAVSKLAVGAFAYAGQVCISVQRIFVQESIAPAFSEYFKYYVERNVSCGDPADPNVICGPIIDSTNADRIEGWITEASQNGADILCGGKREGSVIEPTVLTNVDPNLRIASEEVFGPVVVIDTYADFSEAIAKVNDSRFGLQAGIFSNDTQKVLRAFREIEVGTVVHNDSPSYRIDSMPYGGTKDSGFGREGLRYAIEEMTEPRLLILRESD